MNERYVDARELAALMGLSEPTIKRMTKAGMPSETWGMRVRRYLPSECFAWAQQRDASRISNNKQDSSNSILLEFPSNQRRQ